MGKGVLREGGPLNIRQTGPSQYRMEVPMPKDEAGRTARECPSEECSPGYFKVLTGTGIIGEQLSAFCPYCRHEAEPSDFMTRDQRRYAEELLQREVLSGVQRELKDALGIGASGRRQLVSGLISVEMRLESSPPSPVFRPFEEEVRRDVICPHCTLDQSVYGLATWCADCGADIFLVHVDAELGVIRTMLSDVGRRRESFGSRIAARDLENCLEDVVSIYEAVLRYLFRRGVLLRGSSPDRAEEDIRKLGSTFQNLDRTKTLFEKQLQVALFDGMSDEEVEHLERTFAKRHPITHNLGVVDKKHIERARMYAEEGKEVSVTTEEIETAMRLASRLFAALHARLVSAET